MRKSVIFLTCAMMALVSMSAVADQVIWKEGLNQYVKLVDQGKGADGPAPPNQQPVTLQPEQIKDALETIQTWQKNFLKADQARLVFSSGQADTLGRFLSQALAKARPDQDVIFALVRRNRHFLGIESTTYTAGRAFYAGNRLNIIIGDFDRAPDKLKEAAYSSTGLTEYQIFFHYGRRAAASDFDKPIIATAGVTTHQGRPDWLMIDVPKAAATYAASMQEEEQKKSGISAADTAQIREEQARLEQQRLQLRLEMARFKKEMSEANKGKPATIEQRLTELKKLKDKKLITDAEYQAKRKQILDEM